MFGPCQSLVAPECKIKTAGGRLTSLVWAPGRCHSRVVKMWTFYVVAIITVVVMDLVTLFHYASPKADWMVKTVVAYAWFTNLSIVILVPIDVYTVSGF